ncbi:hypothetical protein BT96DRAFT_929877 [Gymnopus androsaceus JB14]|uniref:Uncharacterized protein n=1 Tax=Gymnopus androsaceus JB14 TaxID=1447944 RepID=A0A6A4GCU4_9AGAR|nr:hypothetical protein BT96DRAFT_929877 [Gymnopus androsaceus JB14]
MESDLANNGTSVDIGRVSGFMQKASACVYVSGVLSFAFRYLFCATYVSYVVFRVESGWVLHWVLTKMTLCRFGTA